MITMHNTCRAFTLYNDSAVPGNTKGNLAEYVSFGYYDGISVSDNLFCEKDETDTFAFLWKNCVKESQRSNGTYLSQIIYAFRADEEDTYEEVFWQDEDDAERPFLFVSLVQLSRNTDLRIVKSLEKRNEFEKELNKKYSNTGCKVLTYLTLDSSDLILVIRSKEYDDGAKIIDSFHGTQSENCFSQCIQRNVGYCYTVASIKRQFLNDEGKIGHLNGVISNVHIYMIESKPGSVQKVYRELSEIESYRTTAPEGEPVLGCNDEVVVFKDVPWNKFLVYYMDNTGCLNHSSSVYAECLIEVTTLIGINRMNSQFSEEAGETGKMMIASPKSICEALLARFRKVENEYGHIGRSVVHILCSLRKFENEHFPRYLYSSQIRPTKMMIDILIEAAGTEMKDNASESFFECQKAFYLSVHNAGRVDRQFTQTPDYNMKMYDVPIKLMMYLTSYVNDFKTYLSEIGNVDEKEPHEYEFLFCPDGAPSTQVLELFSHVSEQKRMFVVQMPEHQIYNLRQMLIMLGHEVAHIVGKKMRNRSGRMTKAITISAKIVVLYVKNALQTWEEGQWKDCINYICKSTTIWQEIEEMIAQKLEEFLQPDFLREYLKKEYHVFDDNTVIGKKIEQTIKRREYSEVLSYLLSKGLQWIWASEGDKLWERIRIRSECYLIISGTLQIQKSQQQLQEKIHEITRKLVIGDLIDENVFSAINTIRAMMNLFSECFADLTVINVIQLPWQDYIKAAVECQKQQNYSFDTKKDTNWLMRMGLVIGCMDVPNTKDDEYGEWNIDEIGDNTTSGIDEQITNALLNYIKGYFYVNDEAEVLQEAEPCEMTSVLDVLNDAAIQKEMLEYLLECKAIFKKSFETGDTQKLQKLRMMYRMFDENTEIQTKLLRMQEHIDTYLSEVLKQERTENE